MITDTSLIPFVSHIFIANYTHKLHFVDIVRRPYRNQLRLHLSDLTACTIILTTRLLSMVARRATSYISNTSKRHGQILSMPENSMQFLSLAHLKHLHFLPLRPEPHFDALAVALRRQRVDARLLLEYAKRRQAVADRF